MQTITIPITGLETESTYRVLGTITRGEEFRALVSAGQGDALVPVSCTDGHWSAGPPEPLTADAGGRIIAVTGQGDGQRLVALADDGGALLISENTGGGSWTSLELPAENGRPRPVVQAVALCGGTLYLATGDEEGGFDLWKAADGWQRLIDQGAGRYIRNHRVWAMAEWGGMVYLSTGSDPEAGLGPRSGAELIRLSAEGSWELVVGEPRFSPVGLQVPFSVMGPGFDVDGHSMIPGLAVSGDRLLALVQRPGTTRSPELWQTADGNTWEPITDGPPALSGVETGQAPGIETAGPGLLVTGRFAVDDERPAALTLLLHG